MRVSIIIVNWNGRMHLDDCLESLGRQSFRDFETVLVDNGSKDGSAAYVRERFPFVKVVELPENVGFAAGNNAGLSHSAGEYLVTLNNDTACEPGWLAELVAVADAHPRAGMVGCRILSFSEPDRIDSLGMRICRDGMSRGAHRLENYSTLTLDKVEPILFPSACVALYRRAMVDEIGFFDEEFFAYCEDTDLGLRGRVAGWEALLARDAVVYHKYSLTAGTFSPLKLYLVERNHYWAALKSFPLPLLALLPFFTILRYLTQAAVVLSGSGAGEEFRTSGSRRACVLALLRGMLDAALGVPRQMKKRKAFARTARVGSLEMRRLLASYRLGYRELLDVKRA